MTQDRRGSARDPEDLGVESFAFGLDGPDPADAFAAAPPRQAAPPRAHAPAPALPEPDDLPDIDGDPFGGPPSFEPAARSPAPAVRHQPDPGDWDSMQQIGGSTPRGGAFGGGDEPDGDPAEEFSAFGGARSVAELGRHPDEPEPKGSYRADEGGHDDVVGSFGDDDDQAEIPKGSLYREDPDDAADADEIDQSLSMDDGADADEGAGGDEEEDGKPSLVDRLKRLAIPVAAVAAIGGAGYVGWGFLSPMLSGSGDAVPIQTAAPIVPKQPAGGLPAFPPTAQAQQRPALPGSAGSLPALPGQQPLAVAQQPVPPRPVGPPALPQAPVLPQASAPLLQPTQSYPAAPAPPQQAAAVQPVLPGPAPADPVRAAAPVVPSLGGGLNGRNALPGDIEAKLAAIATDVALLRSRQEDAARSAQSDRDELRGRLGEVERRLGDARRPPAAQAEREEAKPRRVEREAPAERPARSARRDEPRAAYQVASADDGMPPLKPKVVQGFALKGVSRGVASVEGRGGVVEVGVGQTIPGVGEVKAIRRYGSDWVVVVGKGVIVQQ